MKALVFREFGGTEKLKYEEVPDPTPQENEIIVRVKASSINHLDLWMRQGIRGPEIPMPHISGCDGSGEVVQLGKNVSGLALNEKVLIYPGISCGECRYCKTGWDSLCPAYHIVGYQIQGTFAEYVKIPAGCAIPIPEKLSFEEAASIPLVFLTAYHMLFTRAKIKIGEDVLVMAAGSGVGSSAIQLAKAAGTRVIASAGSQEKLELAKKLGADETINYQKDDLTQKIKNLTGGRGVDVIIEHVGGENFKKGLYALSRNGRIVTCGATAQPIIDLDLRLLFVRHVNLIGSYMGAKWELLEVIKLFQAGKLKAVVDKAFPLSQGGRAQQYVEARKNMGKILLIPQATSHLKPES
jgi:NADPH:quinone reductase-like Zn-dependent oxidoreductase